MLRLSIDDGGLLRAEVSDAIADTLTKRLGAALEDAGNEFNTSGQVNVALFFRDYVIPVKTAFSPHALSELRSLAHTTMRMLRHDVTRLQHRKNPGAHLQWHIKKYQKMVEDLERFTA